MGENSVAQADPGLGQSCSMSGIARSSRSVVGTLDLEVSYLALSTVLLCRECPYVGMVYVGDFQE